MSAEILISSILFLVFGLPSLFLAMQYLLGVSLSSKPIGDRSRKSCVVLMPAHNEEQVISDTLSKLVPQLLSGDRVVVVADNCDDRTAEICQRFDVEVLERHSTTERGKGYALDFGMQHILKQPAETLVIFDADCEFTEGSLERLVQVSQQRNIAVQARYLMKAPTGVPIKVRLAEFAWRVKNQVRPMGQQRLGLSCQLQGSGMAFPWELISGISLASGSIVEDLELGLKLAERNKFVWFEPSSVVESEFPLSDKALTTQRTRWEHGHLASFLELMPRFIKSIGRGKLKVSLMMLDAMIPPTIMWILVTTAVFVVATALALFSLPLAFLLVGVPYLTMVFALWNVWLLAGRDCISVRDIVGILRFIFEKFAIYKKISRTKEKKWVKTERQ